MKRMCLIHTSIFIFLLGPERTYKETMDLPGFVMTPKNAVYRLFVDVVTTGSSALKKETKSFSSTSISVF